MAMASLLLGILAVLMFWGFSNIENDVDDPLLLGVFLLVGILSAQMLIGKGSSICGEESIAYIQSESGPFIAEWSVYSCRSGVGQKLAIAACCFWLLAAFAIADRLWSQAKKVHPEQTEEEGGAERLPSTPSERIDEGGLPSQ
jgi:hypothetical protein